MLKQVSKNNIIMLLKMYSPFIQARFASTLVLTEHNDERLNPLTLNAITAAKKLGHEITVKPILN
jgi:hypothetical protein